MFRPGNWLLSLSCIFSSKIRKAWSFIFILHCQVEVWNDWLIYLFLNLRHGLKTNLYILLFILHRMRTIILNAWVFLMWRIFYVLSVRIWLYGNFFLKCLKCSYTQPSQNANKHITFHCWKEINYNFHFDFLVFI